MRVMTKALIALAWVAIAVPVWAQGEYEPPTAGAGVSDLDREMDRRANAADICWAREQPVAVDWLAEQDSGFRRGAFARYHLSEIDDGWRWVRRDASYGPDLRATQAVQGVPYSELMVHGRGLESPWALLAVDSELANGQVRFGWTAPPAKICMADGLNIRATVEVVNGAPGAQQIVVALPLTQEQVLDEGEAVKACSPQSSTGVDSEINYMTDAGRCERELFHLDPRSEWSVWVHLPESFYVIYRYVPVGMEE